MKVTIKGQITIPRSIREKLNITPADEIDFVEENGRVYVVKKTNADAGKSKFRTLRGTATVKMTTDEIMALTRADQ
ncbi:MAG: AbrB/MazE/SpoVT family DNA-binding domain-containing protein [Desulfobacteraceae bacterium]|nr:AbrB/MazE/SpoVT family DNA-binding domain-containing protein [Desulfobacteraceae bacterium]